MQTNFKQKNMQMIRFITYHKEGYDCLEIIKYSR
jgi:hypothetical protein